MVNLKGSWVTIVISVLHLTQIYWFFTKDQTLLMLEQVKSGKKNCFLSRKLPFLHRKCLRGSELFTTAQVFCSCLLNSILELIHLFFLQTGRNVFLILHKVPHQRHHSLPQILRERDQQSANSIQELEKSTHLTTFFPQQSGHYKTQSNSIYANQLYLY